MTIATDGAVTMHLHMTRDETYNLLRTAYSATEARELTRWMVEEGGGEESLSRLLLGEPVQYVFEHALWMGLDLRVTSATLIPRPETAELVEAVERENMSRKHRSLRILDIGTGSGCIAIALKTKHPEWRVEACDISCEALAIAHENAQRNGTDLTLFRCDILGDAPDGPYDLIVSNPPYICESEKNSMESRVLDYEPARALFVPDQEPLLFYERIGRLAADGLLAPDGQMFFEVNERFGDATVNLFRSLGRQHVTLTKDMFGKDRVVIVS